MVDKNNNSGNQNSGYQNSGYRNSGDWNSGSQNSGNQNSGYRNSGYRNSGNQNSGDWNSGYQNSGNQNSGNQNSGYRNSGYQNSGYQNSGDWNSGDLNSGFFNTNEPNIRLFNKETNLKRKNIIIPYVDLKITEWIPEDKMTKQQKIDDPEFHVKEGTIIIRSYKEAWKIYWNETEIENKNKFLALPNFDAKIFEEITGINVEQKEYTLEDIDINKLSKESLVQIIEQLREK